jgi:hypothetical protein
MSTTTDHNKILGIMHLAYAAFNLLVMTITMLFLFGMFAAMAANQRGGVMPAGIAVVVMIFVFALNLIFTIPSVVAGFAMLKRKGWAKVAGIIAAVVEALNIPLGTALAVYTFWFLFSDRGKALYEKQLRELPPPPPRWEATSRDQREYVPPVGPGMKPPDWR